MSQVLYMATCTCDGAVVEHAQGCPLGPPPEVSVFTTDPQQRCTSASARQQFHVWDDEPSVGERCRCGARSWGAS